MAVTFDTVYNLDVHWQTSFNGYSECRCLKNGVLSANQTALTVFDYFSDTAAINDYIAFGAATPWRTMTFNIGTARDGTVTLVWEYWNGSAWTTIPGGAITDNTNGFQNTGVRTVVIDPEQFTGWLYSTPSGFSGQAYLIRARISAVSGITQGGAQITDKVKYNSDCVFIDGYTLGSPCTPDLIQAANDAGGWGVCVKNGNTSYLIKRHIHFAAAGHFTATACVFQIGTQGYPTIWTAVGNPTLTFGIIDTGGTYNISTRAGVAIYNYNARVGTYPEVAATLRLYASIYWTANVRSANFSANGSLTSNGSSLQGNNFLIYGPSTIKRTQIPGNPYIGTPASAVWDDVVFATNIFTMDHNNYPEFSNVKFDRNGNWMGTYMSSEGVLAGLVAMAYNCDWYNFAGVTPSANTNGRFLFADRKTFDLNVYNSSGTAQQNAAVYITQDTGETCMWLDSTTTVGTLTNPSSWTDQTILVASGTPLAIGQKIRIDAEHLTITNKVTNTLTCTRSIDGTFVTRHAVGKKVWIGQVSLTTDVGGAVTQQTLTRRNLVQFGSATPAPYNTDTVTIVDDNAYFLRIRKYPLLQSEAAFSVTDKIKSASYLSTDPIIQQLTEATVAAYTGITIDHGTQTITVSSTHTTRELYDYCKYNAALAANVQYDDFFTSTDGVAFTCTYNLIVTAPLTGDGTISMPTKLLSISGAGTVAAVVTDSVGTTARLRITLPYANMAVDVHDGTGAQFYYTGAASGVVDLVIPTGSSGTWSWAANKQGYVYGLGDFVPVAGGMFAYAPTCPQVLTPEGVAMYQGTTSALVAIGYDTGFVYIDIGNGTPTLQAIYDEYEDFLMTSAGMDWVINGYDGVTIFNSAGGDFLFMTGSIRLRRATVGDVNATVPAFAQSVDGTPVDEVNGTVRYLTSDSPTAIAAAVMAYVVETGKTMQDMQRLMSAVLLGKSSGAPANPVFRDVNDTKDRVWGAVDANGNRTATVTDAT